jgi:hypothetical protein
MFDLNAPQILHGKFNVVKNNVVNTIKIEKLVYLPIRFTEDCIFII